MLTLPVQIFLDGKLLVISYLLLSRAADTLMGAPSDLGFLNKVLVMKGLSDYLTGLSTFSKHALQP